MTLILTTVHRHGVTQVADRLVSTRAGHVVSEFDPLANKTVLFEARDAFVVIAYTGQAYVGPKPTDQWIAEEVRGKVVDMGPDGLRPVAMSVEAIEPWSSLGTAVDRLAGAVGRVAPASAPLTLVVAGWQLYRRKRPRPVGLTITKGRAGGGLINRLPRGVGRGCWLITEPDGYLSRVEQINLLERLRAGRGPQPELLVGEIRKVAGRHSGVGPHCMSTVILHPNLGKAAVRYDSPVPAAATVTTAKDQFVVPVAFSPWLVSRTVTLAPAIVSGGPLITRVGPWKVVVEAAVGSGEHAGLGLHFSQRRPDRPR